MVFFVEDGKRDPRGFMARPGQILNVAELPARIADVLQSRPSDWRRRRVKAGSWSEQESASCGWLRSRLRHHTVPLGILLAAPKRTCSGNIRRTGFDPTRTLAAAAPECEFAAYSITSSASASTEGGTLKPIALATFILIAR